jgi:uncharacterized RDD family membrane protein YckC
MDCPRCGHQTPAEKHQCPDCAWILSQAYEGNGHHDAGNVLVFDSPVREPAEEGPAFSVEDYLPSPQQPALWADRLNRALPRRLARRRRTVESLGSAAVATVPEEARWEKPAQIEYIQMPLVQSRFDFNAPEDDGAQLAASYGAPLDERFAAGLLDVLLIVSATGLFLGLFALLNSGLSLERKDLLIYLAAAFTIASVYFVFFTLISGATPGMQFRGLRAMTFEGNALRFHHRLWRSFGYVVSTGSLLLGFIWPTVDENRLTWHDYISGTFITDREEF